ncbi:cytochrome P450 [Polyplosphaeria fusca]|uniref:Cytochrome P450 n=1 Tax=Polyplosphaeria fusca TaxID=682080 RepID=A0A9P4QMQ3_9PLEO|nr:cytochrome P450 [Polyplosphaeria fusca]
MELPVNITVVAVAGFGLLALYHFIIYPVFLSTLAQIPNAHPTTAFSSLWILWKKYKQEDWVAVHQAFMKHGDVVRVGPNDIMINCMKDGVLTVYNAGFDKPNFYSALENYGHCMVSMLHSTPHSIRKRMVSHFYSKSYLLNSPILASITSTILHTRLLPYLKERADSSASFDLGEITSAAAIDLNTSYSFGLASATNYMQDSTAAQNYISLYRTRVLWRENMFWKMELPGLTSFLQSLGLPFPSPTYSTAHRKLEDLTLSFCDRASTIYTSLPSPKPSSDPHDTTPAAPLSHISDFPTIYAQLRSSLEAHALEHSEKPNADTIRKQTASELFDVLIAGFDTSTLILKHLVWHLSRHPTLESRLVAELRSLDPPLRISSDAPFPSAKALDALPFLDAAIHETLRLHPPAPGFLPRVVPAGGARIGGFADVPAGTRVSAQAHSLHRNEEVWGADVEEFRPERWMEGGKEGDMERLRWFWAFGSGGRMCVGRGFAVFQIKYLVAAMYTNFRVRMVDEGAVPDYTGGVLRVRVEGVE